MLAIIGGSGVYHPNMLTGVKQEKVKTPYGKIAPLVGDFEGKTIAFLPRHGARHSLPPHRINYQANIWGLRSMGVDRIIATTAVGSLNPQMAPGDYVIIDQFLDFTKCRPLTFYEGGERGVVHMDFTEPYCPQLREVLFKTVTDLGIKGHDHGVYVCTEGPRFETPAEIRMFAGLGGDVVGMTNVPEVVLAREVGICYATVSMVTNLAAGISKTPLTHEEVLSIMKENTEKLRNLLIHAMRKIPEGRLCRCKETARGLEEFFPPIK